MSNPNFKRTLITSTTVHVIVVALVILAPLVRKLLHPRKPPEIVTFVDLSALPPPPPVEVAPEPQPEPEPPKPLPEPEPPKPAPIPEKPAEKPPEPKKPEPPKIKVNTNKIVRRMEQPPKQQPKTQNAPTLTPEQIRKLLEANVKFSSSGSPSATFSDLSLYYATVRDAMYGAWNQPSTVPRGLVAEVSIKVQRSGAVTARRLSRPSGNQAMDDSVMKAVNSISRLRPLPPEVRDDPLDIAIEFVVGDG